MLGCLLTLTLTGFCKPELGAAGFARRSCSVDPTAALPSFGTIYLDGRVATVEPWGTYHDFQLGQYIGSWPEPSLGCLQYHQL